MGIRISDIKNYIEGKFLKFVDKTLDALKDYQKEQVYYRMYKCKSCLDNSKCLYCGCQTPDMFYSPDKIDSQLRWGKFLSEEQWNLFKEQDSVSYTLPTYRVNNREIVIDGRTLDPIVLLNVPKEEEQTRVIFFNYYPFTVSIRNGYNIVIDGKTNIKDFTYFIELQEEFIESRKMLVEYQRKDTNNSVVEITKDKPIYIVKLKDTVKGTITIKKTDVLENSNLQIKRITNSCRCTVVKNYKTNLEEAEVKIDFSIDTENFEEGNFTKYIFVELIDESTKLTYSYIEKINGIVYA